MTVFIAGAIGLLLLASAIILLRRDSQPRPADLADPNLRWYRQRRQELGEADAALVEEAELRLLEDGVDPVAEPEGGGAPQPLGRFTLAALCLLMAVGSVIIYQRTGAVEDVLIYRQLADMSGDTSDAFRAALLDRIERRSATKSDNLQYLGLLGRMHMASQDYAAASSAFDRLSALTPGDPQALALAAQARFLAAGRELDERSQLLAEQSLAVDPNQRTALGLLGMASFEAGAYGAAVSYWERLQSLEAPGSPNFGMLADVITLARERGGFAATEPVPAAGGPEPGGDGIEVELRLHESAAVPADAVVFVFARRAAMASGMPVAVRRLTAGQLPLRLRLADSDAMAGQLLSEAGPVVVSVQVSANGQPGEANALLVASSEPLVAGPDAAVAMVLGAAAADTSAPVVAAAPETRAAAPGIRVSLQLEDSLEFPADAVVYVFARRAGMSGGMPVAVRRLRADALPLTVTLVDGDAMAGQMLSKAGPVVVSAQLSSNGQPGLANALYSGVSAPVTAGANAAVNVRLSVPASAG